MRNSRRQAASCVGVSVWETAQHGRAWKERDLVVREEDALGLLGVVDAGVHALEGDGAGEVGAAGEDEAGGEELLEGCGDGLHGALESAGLGVRVYGRQVPLLLYADDVVLLARSPAELQSMLRVLDGARRERSSRAAAS